MSDQGRKGPTLDMMGKPIWWHHHGSKIAVVSTDVNTVGLQGSAASLLLIQEGFHRHWLVKWRIQHYGELLGSAVFTDEELRRAFNLPVDHHPHFQIFPVMGERYGADDGIPGKFIRWKEYLNIPGPGTGWDGDPNISIKLTPEITNAVQQVLDGNRKHIAAR